MATPAPHSAGDPWATALRLLARRDYGTEELRRRLAAKGFAQEQIEAVLVRAAGLGYLDDRRTVERLVAALLHAGRAAGPRLALELRRRGFAAELIATALAGVRESGGEEQSLRALVARRFPDFDFARADERLRRRVVAFLQRRGFPLDRILNELKRTDS